MFVCVYKRRNCREEKRTNTQKRLWLQWKKWSFFKSYGEMEKRSGNEEEEGLFKELVRDYGKLEIHGLDFPYLQNSNP